MKYKYKFTTKKGNTFVKSFNKPLPTQSKKSLLKEGSIKGIKKLL